MVESFLKSVAVVGAAGKMGSGISLLLLQEMARLEASEGDFSTKSHRLWLIDNNDESHCNQPRDYPVACGNRFLYAEDLVKRHNAGCLE